MIQTGYSFINKCAFVKESRNNILKYKFKTQSVAMAGHRKNTVKILKTHCKDDVGF